MIEYVVVQSGRGFHFSDDLNRMKVLKPGRLKINK